MGCAEAVVAAALLAQLALATILQAYTALVDRLRVI
jgi:hypothetical protein